MAFIDLIKLKLGDKLSKKEMEKFPKGFQKVGDKIIINLPFSLEEKFNLIGENILKIFPNIKSVFVKTGGITGEFRRPQIKWIAGEKNFVVENRENGVYFVYDISKIMFAKGNVSERARLPKLVKDGETIVDMFVGIGYFSVPIAKISNPKKIYGIDLNPDSILWLKKTIEKNKLKNIEVIEGDSKEEVKKLIDKGIIADRVLMGYLPPPEEFIPFAVKILRKGGFIHYDALIGTERKEEDLEKVKKLFEEEAKKRNLVVEIVNAQRVKSYGPKLDHYVVDLQFI